MTDDLVKRLLYCAPERRDCSRNELAMLDAADRIEKLEAALAHIYAWYPISVSEPIKTIYEIRDYANKALEGKVE